MTMHEALEKISDIIEGETGLAWTMGWDAATNNAIAIMALHQTPETREVLMKIAEELRTSLSKHKEESK